MKINVKFICFPSVLFFVRFCAFFAALAAAQEVPGSNRAADKKFMCFSRKSLRYAALGTSCTLTAVPIGRLSLPPSDGR